MHCINQIFNKSVVDEIWEIIRREGYRKKLGKSWKKELKIEKILDIEKRIKLKDLSNL